tara:strand:- start:20447 stop:21112 length:666 start_codon:yes stop_codon:yes gene_type:complete
MDFRPKAILFDLDGVLINTEPLHGRAWYQAAEFFGTHLTKKQIISLRGRRRLDCAEQIIKWIEKPIDMKEFLAVHKPISKGLLNSPNAMDGAKELISLFNQDKIPLALVTSSTLISLHLKCKKYKWLMQIGTKVCGDDKDLQEGKPSPQPYLLAAKRLGINPNSCWAIEDSKSGISSALKAGCGVWVLDQDNSIGFEERNKQAKRVNNLYEIIDKYIELKN